MNCYVNSKLAKEFREAVRKYDGRLGFCLGASMLMFLEADPAVQAEFLTKVFKLELQDQVDDVLKSVREQQVWRVAERELREAQTKQKKS